VEKMAKHSRRLDECSPRKLDPSVLQRRGGTVDSRPGRFAAVETTATRTPPLCLSGASKRTLSAQGHFGSCVPLQLPAESPFLQEEPALERRGRRAPAVALRKAQDAPAQDAPPHLQRAAAFLMHDVVVPRWGVGGVRAPPSHPGGWGGGGGRGATPPLAVNTIAVVVGAADVIAVVVVTIVVVTARRCRHRRCRHRRCRRY
jgi:hypothetical protein